MELIRGLHNLREEHRGCAVTVGAFDGIHLGHQAVLGRGAKAPSQRAVRSVKAVDPTVGRAEVDSAMIDGRRTIDPSASRVLPVRRPS